MDYTNIDWSMDRPSRASVDADWQRTVIVPISDLHPSLLAVKEALNASHDNGGCRIMQYRIDAAPAVSWLVSRNRFGEFELFERFFGSEVVQAGMPEVANAGTDVACFEMESSFVAYGRLAGCISGGGAYGRFSGSDEEALDLARDFARAAFGMRFSSCHVWVNWKPWTSWFAGIAWDGSFFWFDRTTGVATVLLITDTD